MWEGEGGRERPGVRAQLSVSPTGPPFFLFSPPTQQKLCNRWELVHSLGHGDFPLLLVILLQLLYKSNHSQSSHAIFQYFENLTFILFLKEPELNLIIFYFLFFKKKKKKKCLAGWRQQVGRTPVSAGGGGGGSSGSGCRTSFTFKNPHHIQGAVSHLFLSVHGCCCISQRTKEIFSLDYYYYDDFFLFFFALCTCTRVK